MDLTLFSNFSIIELLYLQGMLALATTVLSLELLNLQGMQILDVHVQVRVDGQNFVAHAILGKVLKFAVYLH